MNARRSPFLDLPVLSEQITLTLPKASTECNFFTMAFLPAMRSTPRAKVTVVTIGKPSGIAATARETAAMTPFMTTNRAHVFTGQRRIKQTKQIIEKGDVRKGLGLGVIPSNVPPIVNMSNSDRCCSTPIRTMTPMIPKDIIESFLASSSIESCSGVRRSST